MGRFETGSAHVRAQRNGKVLEILIDRTDKRNALDTAMYAALERAVVALDEDPELNAGLLTGGPDVFSAGNDLRDFTERDGANLDEPSAASRFITALAALRKPIVAAVNGPAVGIGATLLLHCDLVVVGRRARLRFPFVGLGLVPEAGSSMLLPRHLGHRVASELLLLGDFIGGEEAVRIGLANRAVDDGETIPAGRALAERLAALPPASVRATKELILAPSPTLDEQRRREQELFRRMLGTAGTQAALRGGSALRREPGH